MQQKRKKAPIALFTLLAVSGLFLFVIGCTGTAPVGWSGPLIDKQTLYIGDQKGELLALNLENGNQRWAKELVGPSKGGFGCFAPAQSSSAIYGTPAISDGIVYSASYNGKVYAFDASDGAQKWVYPPDKKALKPIVSGPVVASGIVAFGDTDGKIYGLSAADGTEKWVFPTQGKAWATPATQNGILYVPSLDGHVYALKASDGSPVWTSNRVGGIAARPALSATTVYVGSLDNKLYAFDKATGNMKWVFPGGNFFWAGPVLNDSLVIAANTEGKVYGINAETGQQAWVWASPGQTSISSTPTIVNGLVAVGSLDGKINIIDTAKGQPVRDSIATGTTGETSIKGPLASRGNTVYARVESGKRAFVIGYDVTTGSQVMSKELIAAIAPASETPESTSFLNWQTILLIFALMVIAFLLVSRRSVKP